MAIPIYKGAVELTDEQLKKQLDLKQELDWAKDAELEFRTEICDLTFGEQFGKFHVTGESDSYTYKTSSKLTRTLDAEAFNDAIECDELSDAAKACFTMAPKFSNAKLDQLDEDDSLWECFMEKPATPAISIKEK